MTRGRRATNLAFVAVALAAVMPSSSVLAATITVTNILDDGVGSLRQAMVDANLTAGADTITFAGGLTGTITLASNLPNVSQDLTIEGPGQSALTIDGVDTYRPFWVEMGVSFTISDITLKRGMPEGDRGSLLHNQQGTVVANDVTFRDDAGSAAAYNLSTGSVATYTRCSFIGNSTGVGGDHGTTPQTTSDDETEYTNRTYIIDSLFDDNGYGIRQERFTKVTGSTFRNNDYAAYVGGLNRTTILNSTFEDNTTAIGFGNWTPVSWTGVGANNRFVSGNTFRGSDTVLVLNDSWDSGERSQRWTTITNNTWDEEGTWIRAYEWDGSANAMILKTSLNSTGVAWTESGNVSSLAVPASPAPTTTESTTTTIATTTTLSSILVTNVVISELPTAGGTRVALWLGVPLIALAWLMLALRNRLVR